MKQKNYWLFIIIAFSILISCNDSTELGADFFPDESFEVSIIDTATLELGSVRYDSLPTRQNGRLLMGYHEDENFGKISASAYFQMGLKTSDSYFLDAKTTRYDSITLVIKYDGYSIYDTNQIQTLRVHRLLEDIEIPDEDTSFYNTSRLNYEPQPLGELSFYPRPRRGGELEIRLSNSLGTALYNDAITESETLDDQDKFRNFLKGFVIIPDHSKNGSILGFSITSELRLYYRNTARLPATQEKLTFVMTGDDNTSSAGIYFNHIESDRKGTVLEKLQIFESPMPSKSTNSEVFIQGGIGIAARLEMPYLRNLIQADDNFLISKAILEFYPIQNNKNENVIIPNALSALWVDKDNQLISSTAFSATLTSDDEFDRDTHYVMDITNFVKTQMNLENYNKNALLLQLASEYRTSLNQVIIGDAQHPQRIKLKIYLISI